jgi:hypothetical protein
VAQVDHHLREQVGEAVVLAELDHLRVDQDHADLVGCRAHQDRGDDRVDAGRLARAGGPGDEDVGHAGQVADLGAPADVATHGHGQRGLGRPHLLAGQQVA